MSKKRKALQQTEPIQKVKSDVVSFRAFFSTCVARKQVQPWQEKEIHVFFKDLGLSDQEPVDKYKDALAKY